MKNKYNMVRLSLKQVLLIAFGELESQLELKPLTRNPLGRVRIYLEHVLLKSETKL